MLGYDLFSPNVWRDYGIKRFKADIKVAVYNAGIQGKQTVFLVEDFQIMSEGFVEILNSLISSGEAPGLYCQEELESLLISVKERCREEGKGQSPYNFFVNQVKKFLHVVLCMDSQHPKFLLRCESNPALYSLCTILYFGEWGEDSLKQIPILMNDLTDLFHNGERS